MTDGLGTARRVPPVIIISFFLIFMGPGVVQVYLRNLVPPDWAPVKVTSILAALYFSFMFWRLLVVKTQHIIGDKWALTLGLAAYLLVPLALVFTSNYLVLVAMAILWGWGAAAIWQTGPVWLYDNTDSRRRGLWAGLLYMVLFTGLFAGTMFVGLASGHKGRPLMLALLIAPGAAAVVLAALLPARRARAQALSLAGVRSMFLDRRVVILGALLFVSATAYGLLLGAFRDKIDGTFGTLAVGKVLSCFFITRLAFSIVGGHFSDIFARRSVVAAAFLAGGAGLVIAANCQSILSLSAASISLGIVGAVVPVSATAYSADWFTPEKRSLALGAAFVWNDAATALSLLGGQYMVQLTGSFTVPMLAFGVLFLLSTALAFAIPAAPRRPAEVG